MVEWVPMHVSGYDAANTKTARAPPNATKPVACVVAVAVAAVAAAAAVVAVAAAVGGGGGGETLFVAATFVQQVLYCFPFLVPFLVVFLKELDFVSLTHCMGCRLFGYEYSYCSYCRLFLGYALFGCALPPPYRCNDSSLKRKGCG